MLTFGVSGKLTMNALIMYDHQTRPLWSHFLSEGIEGEFKGVRLENVPLVLTTWGEWKASFPDTKALLKGESSVDPYTMYYMRGDAGVIGESNHDERLYGKDLVLGLGFDDGAIAFPHTALQDEEVVNTVVNGEPVVVYYDSQTTTALAYSRVVDGEILEFSLLAEDEVDGVARKWIVDESSGSQWLPLNGQAWTGDYQGTRLDPVHAVNVFWFAWSDFYPETEIYGQ